MKAPTRLANETARLQALIAYSVLDTAPEPAFDDFTELAAEICGTPISLVSLIDEHRQWFKSNVGMPAAETSRDISFCGHAILEEGLLVVADASTDERFADNPLVVEDPHVRFYAGAPLITPDGHAIGALCVMDRVPRTLNQSQRRALQTLSRQAVGQLELRRHARELGESEARLLRVFRGCPVPFSIFRLDNRTFVDVNAAFTSLLGWDSHDVRGHTTEEMNLVDGVTSERLRSILRSSGVLHNEELDVRTRDGDIRHVLLSTEIVELNRESHAMATFVDVTAQRQAMMAANRLAAIVESSDDAIIGKDLDGIVTSWNVGAERTFGYSAIEMVGAPILTIIPADRHDEETHIMTMVRRGQPIAHFETVRRTKAGSLIDVSVSASPIRDADGAIVGVSKVARNVTEQKRKDAAQRAMEAQYRTLFEYAPDGILIADSESNYVDANVSICGMLGYSHAELVKLHASDIVAPVEIGHIGTALGDIKGGIDYRREWLFRRKDGTQFPADVIATAMPNGQLLGMVRDVTERHRTEARMRRLIDSNAQGVMFWNAAGEITDANDEFLRIVDCSREDLLAGRLDWAGMTPPEFADRDRRALREIAEKGVCTPFEKEYTRSDGSRVPVLLGAARFEDSMDEGVCFVLDLTERKKLEQQFYRAQRMESIGTLAGGIAHDLNNVFAPIMLSIEMLRETVTDRGANDLFTMLQSSARHGADLVQQVLSFARGVQGERIPVNPIYLMNDLLAVMRDTFPKGINVSFSPARNLWSVTGDPTQMHQVFLNLCVNARDAMPNGGNLSIRMENVVLDDTYTAMNVDSHPGPYLMVTVADTGTGIPQEIQDRIFEPFFTTKETGRGTGLGLSTTMAIVKRHGGFIHLYSELGNGSKFKVYFPADVSELPGEQASAELPSLPRGNGQLILVVDDEHAIRTVAATTLERFGYRVIVASNGAEAVALYAKRGSEIAVVLTDMAMPVMDGPATIVALKSIDPSVRIIGSSGLALDGSIAKAIGAGVEHFAPKPYTAETILTILHDVLTGAKPEKAKDTIL